MRISAICTDIRRDTEGLLLVVAAEQPTPYAPIESRFDDGALSLAKKQLAAQGIVLGGATARTHEETPHEDLRPPLDVIYRDEQGEEQFIRVDSVEEYSLSSGSTLWYLRLPETLADCPRLIGKAIELQEHQHRAEAVGEQVSRSRITQTS